MKKSEINAIIGRNIRRIRLRTNKSMKEVATTMGISFQQLHKFEKGKDSIKLSQLLDFSTTCNYDPRELVAIIYAELSSEESPSIEVTGDIIPNNTARTAGDYAQNEQYEDLSRYMRPMRCHSKRRKLQQ